MLTGFLRQRTLKRIRLSCISLASSLTIRKFVLQGASRIGADDGRNFAFPNIQLIGSSSIGGGAHFEGWSRYPRPPLTGYSLGPQFSTPLIDSLSGGILVVSFFRQCNDKLHEGSIEMPAPSALLVALISAGSAVIGALLTIILAPRVQHDFWTRQQLAERRLAVADEINELTSSLLADVTEGLRTEQQFFPPVDFFRAWNVADNKFRVFFPGAQRAYFEMEQMLTRDTGIQRLEVDTFRLRQLVAMKAIYGEVGLLRPSNRPQVVAWLPDRFSRWWKRAIS